jgi:hypothetical protein
MAGRRFPRPWRLEPIPGGYRVIDASGLALAHIYGEPANAITISDKRLTNHEAEIIARLIARLPELVELEKDRNRARSRRKPQLLCIKPMTIGDLIRDGKLLEVSCSSAPAGRHVISISVPVVSTCRSACQCRRSPTISSAASVAPGIATPIILYRQGRMLGRPVRPANIPITASANLQSNMPLSTSGLHKRVLECALSRSPLLPQPPSGDGKAAPVPAADRLAPSGPWVAFPIQEVPATLARICCAVHPVLGSDSSSPNSRPLARNRPLGPDGFTRSNTMAIAPCSSLITARFAPSPATAMLDEGLQTGGRRWRQSGLQNRSDRWRDGRPG